MAKRPWGTPAQRAALRKAQSAAAIANRGRKRSRKSIKVRPRTSDPVRRGSGWEGARKNFTPHIRANKNSQTVGFNTGSIVPFTKKRIAVGAYVRVENTKRNDNVIDKALGKAHRKLAPKGTKRAAITSWAGKNVHIDSPAIRANVGGAQVRLGTSRHSGPTIIIRRGKHKIPKSLSKTGIKKYNTDMRKIRKTRRARRGK